MKQYFKINRFITALTALFILSGCAVSKQKETQDKSTISTDTEKKVVIREPSKVVNETKYNVKYKDTTILTTNYETKTVLREIYDSKGNRTTECECEGIREEIETVKQVIQKDIRDRKNTDHSFDPTPFIWALVVFAVIILLIVGLALYAVNSFKKAIPKMVKDIVSDNY